MPELMHALDETGLTPLDAGFFPAARQAVIDLGIVRRRKIDVGGFTKRFAKTVKIDLNRDEREFYDRTTEYVKTEFNRALSRGDNLKSFIMIVFQKLLDSSAYALLKALDGRRARLEGFYFRVMQEISESEEIGRAHV